MTNGRRLLLAAGLVRDTSSCSTPMNSITSRAPGALLGVVGSLTLAWPVGLQAQQLSPSGYTGAINTPTTQVLSEGSLGMALTNSIPETKPKFPGTGSFGGLNMGFGLLPGLEAVGRLTFNGDLNCDLYEPGCKSDTRDLSVGAKYRVPLEWLWPKDHWLQPGLAFGVTDYGGAATLYRQKYAVGSLRAGPVTLNAGKASSLPGGLMHGQFGSASVKVFEHWSVILERDTREYRAGLAWNRRLTDNWDIHLAASRKLTQTTTQQTAQATVGLTYFFGRGEREAASRPMPREALFAPAPLPAVQAPAEPPPPTDSTAPQAPASATAPAPALPTLSIDGDAELARHLADQFKAFGFSDIDIGHTPSGWVVRAEPRQWRQNRMDAFGAGLAAFTRVSPRAGLHNTKQLSLILTYMGQSVGGLQVGGEVPAVECIQRYLEGQSQCGNDPALRFFFDPNVALQAEPVQWLISAEHGRRFMPQFEISPAAAYTAGTEFGLLDYSVGATLGWEVPLAKGLQWQGYAAKLLTESDDFRNPNSYFRRVGLGEATRPGANLLVYQHPLLPRLWGQAAVGNIGYQTSGAQVNAFWASEDGRYRTTWIKGRWHNPALAVDHQPNILTFGVRPLAPNVQFSWSTGRYFNNDTGQRLSTAFSFADYGIQLYWRKTGPSNLLPNRNAYMGFTLTMPLGPKRAAEVGPATFRLRDRWELGLETKVGQVDNYIEPGYGLLPVIRHNIDTDVFDFNRSDYRLINENSYRTRVTARELLAATVGNHPK